MAQLFATFGFDIDGLNLNWYVQNYSHEDFRDNIYAPTEDVLHIYDTYGFVLSFYGNGMGYDANGKPVHGTVEALAEWFLDTTSGNYVQAFLATGLDVRMVDLFNAAQTPSTSDDMAIFRSEFSGRDLIYLSAFDDTMRGFNGNDKMYGYAGMDILRGDAGRDKLFGGAGNDVLKGGSGDDILRGGNGRDKEFGGGGEDTFVFRTGDDKSIIRDFDSKGAAHDVIDLSGLASVRNWTDLTNNHMVRDGSNVEIDGGGGDIIVIKDVTLSSLDKGDFLF